MSVSYLLFKPLYASDKSDRTVGLRFILRGHCLVSPRDAFRNERRKFDCGDLSAAIPPARPPRTSLNLPSFDRSDKPVPSSPNFGWRLAGVSAHLTRNILQQLFDVAQGIDALALLRRARTATVRQSYAGSRSALNFFSPPCFPPSLASRPTGTIKMALTALAVGSVSRRAQ